MKQLLRSMRLVQARVPCTDGSRHRMQSLMRSLQYWSGFPALFLTLNPADTHHPFTLHYGSLEDAASIADLPDMDTQQLGSNLGLSWPNLPRLGAVMGVFWINLGLSWLSRSHFGPSRAHLGTKNFQDTSQM